VKPKRDWFVRKAKTVSRCWICKQQIQPGESITRYCKHWPHFECAKRRDAEICAGS